MQENITWWQLRDRILQLPWRDRLSLLWAIVRSFFRWVPKSNSPTETPVPEKRKRIPDLSAGAVWMSDDFDDPLPDSFWLGEE